MKCKPLFLLVAAAFIFGSSQAQSSAVKDYINTYHELAINEMLRTGIPASITLAQGILESQAGQSDLVKQSNNHFGIKCKPEWTGPKIYHDDDEKGECFRGYASAEESYRDHSDFLKNRPYYAALFDLNPVDFEAWAYGLKKAGYATERDYPQALIRLISDNHLQDYTLVALQRQRDKNTVAANTPNTPNTAVTNAAALDVKEQPANNNPTSKATVQMPVVNAPVAVTPAYPPGIFAINQTKVVYAHEGASLFALANNFNIAYSKLLEFNELDKTDILAKNQLIFLERKPKKGAANIHVVCINESLEDIAQVEAVRIESLWEYNRIPKGAEPAAGEKIYLQGSAPATPRLVSTSSQSRLSSR